MSAQQRGERAKAALASRSPFMVRFFGRAFERTLAADFHAVRLSRSGTRPAADAPKLAIYLNHPSWWDAVICVVVAKRLFPTLIFRAPIDAAMLKRYRFMARIGLFGIEQGTRRGAADFMTICREVFADPRNLLMITAQGRFADTRERPLRLEAGIAHLADIDAKISFVPLAVEYCFWAERKPELLLRFGPILSAQELARLPNGERLGRLEQALQDTMDGLAKEAMIRNEEAFETIFTGKRGVHPLYDAWRRARAFVSGRSFNPEHGGAAK